MLPEPIAVTLQVVDVLDQLGVPYVIGGSLASSLYGVVRTTLDADVVADLRPHHVEPLVAALRGAFYVDAQTVQEAITYRGSFNVIHLETMFKVDVFIPKRRPFDQAQLERRILQVIATDPERTAYMASAEDTILAKLDWYRQGGQVSERQWRDVLGVLRVQGDSLDMDYLRRQAAALGVADLLEQSLAQTGQVS
jgi:hypothetical protein